jgi:ATP-dependent DNA helicase RecG
VFYRARLIEHWGTGTLRMIDVCKKHGLRLEFQSDAGVFMTRFLKRPQKAHFIPKQELNARQQKVLNYLQKYGDICRSDYERICTIGKRQAVKDLNQMVKKHILKKTGSGKSTRYMPVDQLE